jgi:hypothetical protein
MPESHTRRTRSPRTPARRIVAALAAAAVLGTSAAQAACYSDAEFEAEQAIRLQSELTVIAFGCPTPPGMAQLPAQYGEFSRRHGEAYRGYQRTITDYLRRHERSGRPQALFDRFQSVLANEYGFRAGKMTPAAFCEGRLPFFAEVMSLDREGLRRMLRDDGVLRLASQPLCTPREVRLPEPEVVAAGLRATVLP